jgi:hypothetical protein
MEEVILNLDKKLYDMLVKDTVLAREIDTRWYRKGEGFYDWAKDEGYEMSELGHPIPEAHYNWIHDKYTLQGRHYE